MILYNITYIATAYDNDWIWQNTDFQKQKHYSFLSEFET